MSPVLADIARNGVRPSAAWARLRARPGAFHPASVYTHPRERGFAGSRPHRSPAVIDERGQPPSCPAMSGVQGHRHPMRTGLLNASLCLAALAAAGPAQGRREAQRRGHPRRRPGLGRPERPRQHEPDARRTSTRWRATGRCSSGSSSARSARRRGPSSSPAAIIRAAACADVSTGGERLNLDEKTIADVFKAAGYATGAFGKWHNGTQYPYHPNARGFDEYYGFTLRPLGRLLRPAARPQRPARARARASSPTT